MKHLTTILAAVLCIIFLATTNGQQVSPFLGQGLPPDTPGGTNVYVSVGLDRLLSVDDIGYKFEVILFMLLSWEDPRAKAAMLAATEQVRNGTKTSCNMPCSGIDAYEPDISLCCDDVWLPTLQFTNCRGMSQDRMVRYDITFDPTSDAVAWWTNVQGEFYTNLAFKSFPYDTQKLIVQLQYSDRVPERPVNFNQSSISLSLYLPAAGDPISGWTVQSLKLYFYKVPEKYILDLFSPSNPNDPFPIHPVPPNNNTKFISELWKQGFAVIIEVNRISVYFLLSAIIPIALNVWIALLVFSVSPRHLDTRLGIIVSLFLSLTALQLVVSASLPQASTIVPTQQLCLLSYFVLGFIGLESIIIYKIVSVERQAAIKDRTLKAKREFLQKWRRMRRSCHIGTENDAVDKGCTPSWLRRRKKGQNATDNDQVAVDIAPARPPPRVVERKNNNTADSELGSLDRNDTMDFLPFGGITHAPSSRFPSQQPLPDSESSHEGDNSYAGSEEEDEARNTSDTAGRGWFGKQTNRIVAGWREMRESPDYALYIALSIDRFMFWFILIAYDVILIVILAANAIDQPKLSI